MGVLESLLNFRAKVGAWCGTLALFAGAAILWIAPEDLAAEIPLHKEIAVAVGVFGIFMFFALILKGNAGYRAKALVLCLLSVLVGGGAAWWIQGTVQDVLALHETGEVRQVSVVGTSTKYNPKSRKRTMKTQVMVEGARVSVALGWLPRRGEVVQVLVAPKRPQAIVSGGTEKEWLPIVDAICGRWFLIGFSLVALFCFFAIPINLCHVIFGPPKNCIEKNPQDANAPKR